MPRNEKRRHLPGPFTYVWKSENGTSTESLLQPRVFVRVVSTEHFLTLPQTGEPRGTEADGPAGQGKSNQGGWEKNMEKMRKSLSRACNPTLSRRKVTFPAPPKLVVVVRSGKARTAAASNNRSRGTCFSFQGGVRLFTHHTLVKKEKKSWRSEGRLL